ncbi:MAG: hypothetical protein IJO24_03935 [Clostridia bacterium]|nr:hypothetical protein [Clostridia bacterium]
MKKVISIVLVLVLFTFPLTPFAQAASNAQIEYFEDGSYMIISSEEDIEHEDNEVSLGFIEKLIKAIRKLINLILGKSNVQTVKDIKYVHYYDKNGVRLWSVYVEGTFTYNSKSATCTNASTKYYIYDNDWEMIYCNAEKSGATATANFKIRQYKLGIPLKVIERAVTLTCDENGKTT